MHRVMSNSPEVLLVCFSLCADFALSNLNVNQLNKDSFFAVFLTRVLKQLKIEL